MGLSKQDAERLGIGHLHPANAPKGGRGRQPAHVRGVPNRTERRYMEHLEARRLAGEVKAWAFEEDTLRLAPDMTLTPDFRVEMPDGWTEYHDVKRAAGWTHDDSVAKGKAAATIFPFHRFYLAVWHGDEMTPAGVVRPGYWRLRRLGVRRGKAC